MLWMPSRPGPVKRLSVNDVPPKRPVLRLVTLVSSRTPDGADTVTVTKNEIRTALNMPDDFILAIVEVDGQAHEPRYLRRPFRNEPDFGASAVIYRMDELLTRAEDPS